MIDKQVLPGTLLRSYRNRFTGDGYFENIYTDYEVKSIDSNPESRFIQLINDGKLYNCSPVSPHRADVILPLGQNQLHEGLLKGNLKVLAWGDSSVLKDDYFDDSEVSEDLIDKFYETRQWKLL